MSAPPPKSRSNPLVEAVAFRDGDVLSLVEEAVRTRNVRMAYQPVQAASPPHDIVFYESFLRVCDGSGRVIPAHAFMHRVEETETGRLLDCIALDRGLATLAAVPGLRLSVNMSGRSIGYRKWRQVLERHLSRDPTLADRLILEINEDSVIRLPELAQSFIAELRGRGLSFALDDFGAGRSDFRALGRMDFDILKLDGCFTRNLDADPDHQAVARAIRAVAEEFGMLTIAEQVERAEDAAFLEEAGYDCLQGYFFAAPTLTPPWVDPAGSAAGGNVAPEPAGRARESPFRGAA